MGVGNVLDQRALVELARMAWSQGDGVDGGRGNMGIVTDGTGKTVAVKFDTKWSCRSTTVTDDVRLSCNRLRQALYDIALNSHISQKKLDEIKTALGISLAEDPSDRQPPTCRDLLSRKVVAKVVKMIDGDIWEKAWSGEDTENLKRAYSSTGVSDRRLFVSNGRGPAQLNQEVVRQGHVISVRRNLPGERIGNYAAFGAPAKSQVNENEANVAVAAINGFFDGGEDAGIDAHVGRTRTAYDGLLTDEQSKVGANAMDLLKYCGVGSRLVRINGNPVDANMLADLQANQAGAMRKLCSEGMFNALIGHLADNPALCGNCQFGPEDLGVAIDITAKEGDPNAFDVHLSIACASVQSVREDGQAGGTRCLDMNRPGAFQVDSDFTLLIGENGKPTLARAANQAFTVASDVSSGFVTPEERAMGMRAMLTYGLHQLVVEYADPPADALLKYADGLSVEERQRFADDIRAAEENNLQGAFSPREIVTRLDAARAEFATLKAGYKDRLERFCGQQSFEALVRKTSGDMGSRISPADVQRYLGNVSDGTLRNLLAEGLFSSDNWIRDLGLEGDLTEDQKTDAAMRKILTFLHTNSPDQYGPLPAMPALLFNGDGAQISNWVNRNLTKLLKFDRVKDVAGFGAFGAAKALKLFAGHMKTSENAATVKAELAAQLASRYGDPIVLGQTILVEIAQRTFAQVVGLPTGGPFFRADIGGVKYLTRWGGRLPKPEVIAYLAQQTEDTCKAVAHAIVMAGPDCTLSEVRQIVRRKDDFSAVSEKDLTPELFNDMIYHNLGSAEMSEQAEILSRDFGLYGDDFTVAMGKVKSGKKLHTTLGTTNGVFSDAVPLPDGTLTSSEALQTLFATGRERVAVNFGVERQLVLTAPTEANQATVQEALWRQAVQFCGGDSAAAGQLMCALAHGMDKAVALAKIDYPRLDLGKEDISFSFSRLDDGSLRVDIAGAKDCFIKGSNGKTSKLDFGFAFTVSSGGQQKIDRLNVSLDDGDAGLESRGTLERPKGMRESCCFDVSIAGNGIDLVDAGNLDSRIPILGRDMAPVQKDARQIMRENLMRKSALPTEETWKEAAQTLHELGDRLSPGDDKALLLRMAGFVENFKATFDRYGSKSITELVANSDNGTKKMLADLGEFAENLSALTAELPNYVDLGADEGLDAVWNEAMAILPEVLWFVDATKLFDLKAETKTSPTLMRGERLMPLFDAIKLKDLFGAPPDVKTVDQVMDRFTTLQDAIDDISSHEWTVVGLSAVQVRARELQALTTELKVVLESAKGISPRLRVTMAEQAARVSLLLDEVAQLEDNRIGFQVPDFKRAVNCLGAVKDVFDGKVSVSAFSMLGGKYESWAICPDFSSNVQVESKRLGSGSFNTVYRVVGNALVGGEKYYVMKSTVGVDEMDDAQMFSVGSVRFEKNIIGKNLANTAALDLLDVDVAVRTLLSPGRGMNNQPDLMMEMAQGYSLDTWAAPDNQDRFDVDDKNLRHALMKDGCDLDWFDWMTGQTDRHFGNCNVTIDEGGNFHLKALDNDLSFNEIRTGIHTIECDEKTKRAYESICGSNPGLCFEEIPGNNPKRWNLKLGLDAKGKPYAGSDNYTMLHGKLHFNSFRRPSFITDRMLERLALMKPIVERWKEQGIKGLVPQNDDSPATRECLESFRRIRSVLGGKGRQFASMMSRIDEMIGCAEELEKDGMVLRTHDASPEKRDRNVDDIVEKAAVKAWNVCRARNLSTVTEKKDRRMRNGFLDTSIGFLIECDSVHMSNLGRIDEVKMSSDLREKLRDELTRSPSFRRMISCKQGASILDAFLPPYDECKQKDVERLVKAVKVMDDMGANGGARGYRDVVDAFARGELDVSVLHNDIVDLEVDREPPKTLADVTNKWKGELAQQNRDRADLAAVQKDFDRLSVRYGELMKRSDVRLLCRSLKPPADFSGSIGLGNEVRRNVINTARANIQTFRRAIETVTTAGLTLAEQRKILEAVSFGIPVNGPLAEVYNAIVGPDGEG